MEEGAVSEGETKQYRGSSVDTEEGSKKKNKGAPFGELQAKREGERELLRVWFQE